MTCIHISLHGEVKDHHHQQQHQNATLGAWRLSGCFPRMRHTQSHKLGLVAVVILSLIGLFDIFILALPNKWLSNFGRSSDKSNKNYSTPRHLTLQLCWNAMPLIGWRCMDARRRQAHQEMHFYANLAKVGQSVERRDFRCVVVFASFLYGLYCMTHASWSGHLKVIFHQVMRCECVCV